MGTNRIQAKSLKISEAFQKKSVFFNKTNERESKQPKVYCRDIFEDVIKTKNPFIYKKEEEGGGRIKKEQKEMKKNSELSNVSKS